MARELGILIARRGKPATVVSDNGTEMTSRAMLAWTNRSGAEWLYITPGKPQQNAPDLMRVSTESGATSTETRKSSAAWPGPGP